MTEEQQITQGQPSFPKDLKDAVHLGKVVPFAGAGVSMAVRRRGETVPAYPSWRDFLLRAAERLDLECVPTEANLVRSLIAASPPDFLQAAKRAERGLGSHRWVKFLRDQFELRHNVIDSSSLDLARALWTLAPNLLITSNFDLTLRWACPDLHDLREWGLDDPHGYAELLETGRLDRPAVWHCHGMIQRPQDLVLAVDGYAKLYSLENSEQRWESALATLGNVMLSRTLLFVGFSFTDDYFSNELALVSKIYRGAGRTHYVLVRRAEQAGLEARLRQAFPSGCICCVPYEEHGEPLVKLLQHLATFRGGGDGGPPPPAGAGGGSSAGAQSTTAAPEVAVVQPVSVEILPANFLDRSRAEVDAMLLLEAWTPNSSGDVRAVEELGADASVLERVCTELAALSKAPIRYDPSQNGVRYFAWSEPEKVWPQLIGRLPPSLLSKFSELARKVLSERDPALDLAKEERFLAAIHGKVLGFSAALREGIAQTLVRLANSDESLKPAHGTSRGSLLAHTVVYHVLEPEWQRWASLDGLLPLLAEAAPSGFLDRVDASLALNDEGVARLLSEESGFATGRHTGLLWALETIGWIPELMPRVVLVLAKLAARDPGGRLANRPMASLVGLLHPLLPQSRSTAHERLKLIKLVMKREFAIGWKLGVELLGTAIGPGGFMTPSRRPQLAQWSIPEESDQLAPDHWQQTTGQLELLIEHVGNLEGRWLALLDPLWRMPDELRKRVLGALIERVPAEHCAIWAKLRELLHDAYAFGDAWKISAEILLLVEELYRQLTPDDFVMRIGWLFASGAHLPERVEGGWRGEEARLETRRGEAVAEVWKREDRWLLLGRLSALAGVDWRLGITLAEASFADDVEAHLLGASGAALLNVLPAFAARRHAVKGIEWLRNLVDELRTAGRTDEATSVLVGLRPSAAVWDLVDSQGEPIRSDYWRRLGGVYGDYSADDTERALSALVSVGQLSVALAFASASGNKLRPETALDLLERLAIAPDTERTRLAREGSAGYHLERVFGVVDRMTDLPEERVVKLERAFHQFLEDTQRGARRLGLALAKYPELFVECLIALYKAESATSPPPELTDEEKQRQETLAKNAYRVLRAWKGFPGEDLELAEDRESAAVAWAEQALRLAAEADRARTGAHAVGNVLARMPASSVDATWPSEAAREILKRDGTTEVGRGIYIEKRNSRGVTTRAIGEGGRQERELSATFRKSAATLRLEWPEAAAVLDQLAESYEHDAQREDAEAAADRHRYKMDKTESND